MAKKKKDVEENIENKEEFNDIDENFGLPDIEPEPLEDLAEEPAEEVTEEVIEETSTVHENSDTEEEMYVAAQVSEEGSFNEEEYSEETKEEEKPAYVPGTYASKAREEESNSGKIIGVIIVLVLIGAGLWYFMYYQPAQVTAEKAKQEQVAADKIKKEKERIAAEKAKEEKLRLEEEARLQAEEDAKPKIGTIETISQKTSRYYVVVSSGLDGDLAMDYAKKEVNNGTNIKLLSPLGTNKFYRVTVADYDTWVEAENAANDMKSTFGDGVWVLKY